MTAKSQSVDCENMEKKVFPCCQSKLLAIDNELKLITAELNVITTWIDRKFGNIIINRNSDLFHKHIYKLEEIESLSQSLTLPYDVQWIPNPYKRSAKKQKRKRTLQTNPAQSEQKKCSNALKSDKPSIETIALNDGIETNTKSLDFKDVLDKVEVTNVHKLLYQRKGKCISKKSLKIKPKKEGTDKHTKSTEKGARVKSADWRKYACSGPKQCDECGKLVMGTSSLKQHQRMHADERPYECPECGNTFRYRKNLKIHMIALHNGERHLQCSFCGKKFYAPKDLKIHERTHTGHKPFACHLCPKKFNIKGHLTMHIRVHTGERPYRCSICDKSFSQANSLRIHKKIHMKVKDDKPQKKCKKSNLSAKTSNDSASINVHTEVKGNSSTADNLNNELLSNNALPSAASNFQLMVPTMQTVTAAIVSLSTVNSPFPTVNILQTQGGRENTPGTFNTLNASSAGESFEQEPNSSFVAQSSLMPGNSLAVNANNNAEQIIDAQLNPIQKSNLGDNTRENFNDTQHTKINFYPN